MCSKGSGSPPVPGSTSTAFQSATAANPNVAPMYQNFLSNAYNLSQTPFNPAMLGQVAPLTQDQLTAGAQIMSLSGQLPSAAANVAQVGSQMGTWDPTQVQSMMSPYTQSVVQATQNWFNNQNAIQGTDLLSQGIRSGNAFGGDREGIAAAQLAGQQQLAQAPVIAGLNQQGYTQALNEYNQLKQYGLMGAQAGLGADLQALQGTQAALGWGTMEQQQQQREFDVAQQNAMMESAYPFQLQNWYGSVLGGIGPLQGSFAQGYTTPPPPNATNQIVGGISALAGLGTSLFSKRGGVVRRRRGGGVPILLHRGGFVIPLRFGGPALMHLQRGGYVLPLSPPRRQRGGLVQLRYQTGGLVGDSMPGMQDDEGMGTLNIKQYQTPSSLDAGAILQRMEAQAQRAQQQQSASQNPNFDLANAIKGVGSVAKAAAPLFALLKSGGSVRYYQDGGDGDGDGDGDQPDNDVIPESAQPTVGTTGAIPLPPVTVGAGAVPLPTARPADAPSPPPAMAPPGTFPEAGTPQTRLQPGETPPFDPTAGGETPPAPRRRPSAAGPPAGPAGDGAGPYYGAGTPGRVQTIPGLEPPPRSFLQRLAVNPLWNAGIAMLGSHSPYFGVGLASGMQAATGAIERERREQLLDPKAKIIDNGQTLSIMHGNKLISTSIPSPKAAAQGQAAQQRADARIDQYTKEHLKALKEDDDWYDKPGTQQLQEANIRAREQWNTEHPERQVTVPERKTAPATPPGTIPPGVTPPAAPQRTAGTTPPSATPPDTREPVPGTVPMTVTGQSAPPPAAAPTTTPPAATPPATGTAAAAAPVELSPQEEAQRIDQNVAEDPGAGFKTPLKTPQRMLGDVTPQQFDGMAVQVAWGRPVRDFASGAGSGPFRKALQARAQQYWIDHGVKPEIAMQYVHRYAAQQAGARTLAIQEARLTNAIQEVRGTAQQVLDISARIPRTQYPTLNNLYLAAQRHTGGQEVAALNVALETLVNDYAATLGRGNNQLTDSAREQARGLLEMGYSHGQMQRTVDQMLTDIDRAHASVRRGMDLYLGLASQPSYRPGDIMRTAPAPTTTGGGATGAPARGAPAGPPGGGPTQREINGRTYVWDGRGWKEKR